MLTFRPVVADLPQYRVQLGDPERREGARKGGGGARGERK